MKNRIASLFLAFVMMVSLLPNAVARDNKITVQSGGAERFTDVPTSHWAYGYIDKVVGSGLFNGRTYNEFEPSSAMTRSQFVMVLARMEGHSDLEGQVTQTVFPDVTSTRRAAGPIAWATQEGIVQGFGDGTFKPDSPMTRGQFAALIHRYIVTKGYTNLNVLSPEPDQFTDAASVSSAFTSDVEYARTHGLLTGYSDGTVRASNPVTRAAIAAILARFLDLVGESIDPLTNDYYVPFLDYPRPDSGDSGTKPTDGSYADLKLKVSGEEHGATPYCTATRNGAAVAYDDLKAGDIVTVHFNPDSGYEATVTVKDSKGNRVTVKKTAGDDNSVWFTMPENMPVTVTVTYTRISSGGGGGGGSGGGSTSSYLFYLNLKAALSDTAAGSAYADQTSPMDDGDMPSLTSTGLLRGVSRTPSQIPTITGYAWFVLKDGWTITGYAIDPEEGAIEVGELQYVKLADGKTVYYYPVSAAMGSRVQVQAPTVTLTAMVEEGEEPPVGDKNWTVSVNNAASDNVFTKLASSDTSKQVLKADDTKSLAQESVVGSVAYLYVTPEEGYYLDKVEADDDATVTRVYPADAEETVRAGKLAIYKVEIPADKIGENATTKLTVTAAEEIEGSKLTRYDVNIQVQVTDEEGKVLETVDYETLTEAQLAVAPYNYSIKVNPSDAVVKGDAISVTAETKSDFGDYQLTGIQLFNAVAQNEPLDEAKDLTATDSFVEHEFTNIDQDVTVCLTYQKLRDDETMYYPVTADFGGAEGEVSVIIGNYKKTFDSANETQLQIISMTHKEYLAAYPECGFTPLTPDSKWILPVSVNDKPLGRNGYTFTDNDAVELYKEQSDGTELIGKLFPDGDTGVQMAPVPVDEEAYSVHVTMTPTVTLGYDLTIIGKGSVKVEADVDELNEDTPYTNDSDTQTLTKSKSVSLVGKDDATLTLTVSAKEADYKTGAAWDVSWSVGDEDSNAEDANEATYEITIDPDEGVTKIVVEFHESEREVVLFFVGVSEGGGYVEVKPESGKMALRRDVFSDYLPEEEMAANAKYMLDEVPDEAADRDKVAQYAIPAENIFGNWQGYYAYEGTMITVVPYPDEDYKVSGIYVIDYSEDSPHQKEDLMQTAGFSFKAANDTEVYVSFGKTGALSFLAQAPFDGAFATSTKGKATHLQAQIAELQTGLTVKDLLYALNDGKNFTKTANNLDKVFDRYFNGDSNKNPAEFESTARYKLKDRLEETVSDQIDVKEAIKARKNAIFSSDASDGQPSKAETAISDGLSSALSGNASTKTFTITDSKSKGKFIQALAETNASLNGVADKDITVKVEVTPLLDKLQSSLTSVLVGYLKAADVKVGDTEINLNVDVYGYDKQGVRDESVKDPVPLQITISADAAFATLPELDFTLDADDLMNKVTVYATVKTTVTFKDTAGKSQTIEETTTEALDDLGLSDEDLKTVKDEIIGKLSDKDNGVEKKVKEQWETELNNLIKDGKMDVKMSDALDATLLDGVISKMLDGEDEDSLTNKAFSKVQSLGDAVNTRTAFENLYSKFVVFGEDVFTVNLLKPDGARMKIGEFDEDGNLVVTLAFDNYSSLKDSGLFVDKDSSNNTPYEKLVDLLLALRAGIDQDIAENNDNETTASVVAELLANQVQKGRGYLKATKWGTQYSSKNPADGELQMSANTIQELSKLVAGLMMADANSVVALKEADDQTGKTEWQKFEDSGYQSVSFVFDLKRGRAGQFGEAIKGGLELDLSSINAGFSVTQNFK